MTRTQILSDLIGRPWSLTGEGPEAWSCYGLFRHLQGALWRRSVPFIAIPAEVDLRWIQSQFDGQALRSAWRFCPLAQGGIIQARDGAAVLMAGVDRPHHIGVWLAAEHGVIHSDDRVGVIFQTPAELRASGLPRQRFYEAR
ncbi:hypothetical protein [Aquabacter cavernae]|uniref:hypothetical protein n=1 Tax=Aquabacter cavernae TaxID=2496029 RepID=UPI000F8D77FD|nr:hypothetical protein [Aquabacter cavernae]